MNEDEAREQMAGRALILFLEAVGSAMQYMEQDSPYSAQRLLSLVRGRTLLLTAREADDAHEYQALLDEQLVLLSLLQTFVEHRSSQAPPPNDILHE